MVSSRPHNFFDTASYAKPLRFQINLATFLNSIRKHFEKICPLGNSTGTFWGQNSKIKDSGLAIGGNRKCLVFPQEAGF